MSYRAIEMKQPTAKRSSAASQPGQRNSIYESNSTQNPSYRSRGVIGIARDDSSDDLDDLWKLYEDGKSSSASPIAMNEDAQHKTPVEVLQYGRPERPAHVTGYEPPRFNMSSYRESGIGLGDSPTRTSGALQRGSHGGSQLSQARAALRDAKARDREKQRQKSLASTGRTSHIFKNKKVNPFMVVMYVNRILQLARMYKKPIIEEPLTVRDLLKRGILHPASKIKQFWDLTVIAIVIYNVLLIPFRICFDYEARGALQVIEYTFDAFFALDILLNFRTAYMERENLVIDFKRIARHYLKTWFAVDFLSTFPFDIVIVVVLNSTGDEIENDSVLRLPRLIRVLRLIRLMRLIKVFKVTKSFRALISRISINTSLFKLMKLGVMLLVVAHWFGCLWYYTADLTPAGQYSWAFEYKLIDEATREPIKPVSERYIASFYWAVATITTVGYGDIVPENPAEQIMAILCLMIGVTAFSYAVGTMSSIVQQLDQQSIEFNNKLSVVNRYVDRYQLPSQLAFKMRDHYRYVYNQEGTVFKHQEKEILSSLPSHLKEEIADGLLNNKLAGFELLRGYPPHVITEFIARVTPQHLDSGSTLFEKGDKARHLYILTRGQLQVLSDDRDVYAVLHAGACVGEVALLIDDDHERMATVEAVTDCELFSLEVNDFEDMLQIFPPLRDRFLALARTRVIKSAMRDNLKKKMMRRKTLVGLDTVVDSPDDHRPHNLMSAAVRDEAFAAGITKLTPSVKALQHASSLEALSTESSTVSAPTTNSRVHLLDASDGEGDDTRRFELPGSTGADKEWQE
eukprot:TRINITY_DN40451_c0_g1_i1.p1 TRINITY_DN40451_c0_g1~~TRINITY_DN40451_c0_g1_i1.p1  ORF type:complete len:800 (+),score=93.72 TRINITY_DN40451_c0_g1_i1:114-2513(+)